jgi:hypothetical protein
LYWLTVLCLTSVAWVWIAIEVGRISGGRPGSPLEILLVLVLVFPVVQLAASLVSAVLVGFLVRDQPGASWVAIARITLWSALGALLGALALMCTVVRAV